MNFDGPVTCLVTSGASRPSDFGRTRNGILAAIGAAVDAGVNIIQIREKHLSAKQLFDLSTDALKITTPSDSLLVVNDRADIALAAGADGVHLRSDSIPAAVVRGVVPNDFLIGVSTHSLTEIKAAKSSGADFAFFGPVFSTPGKNVVVGIQELKRVAETVSPFPVIAIGGIDETNVQSVLSIGAAGFAAIRFMHNKSGLNMARRLRLKEKL